MSSNLDSKVVNSKYYDTLLYPIVTEKSQLASEYNKYYFSVSVSSDKPLVKTAVEKVFDVKVDSVSIINRKGKSKTFKGIKGKRKSNKIAIVTLSKGQNLDIGVFS